MDKQKYIKKVKEDLECSYKAMQTLQGLKLQVNRPGGATEPTPGREYKYDYG